MNCLPYTGSKLLAPKVSKKCAETRKKVNIDCLNKVGIPISPKGQWKIIRDSEQKIKSKFFKCKRDGRKEAEPKYCVYENKALRKTRQMNKK